MLNETQVKTIVVEALRQRFADEDYINSDVVIEEDFDGEEVVRVTAHFQKHGVTSLALFATGDAIRDRLLQSGDKRFVFIRQLVEADPKEIFSDVATRGRKAK